VEIVVEPTLMVIGLNHRTAPAAVRERFWINEERRHEALLLLIRSEGIDEAMVLVTCNRTEFLLWASDAELAADSAFRFLSSEYGLKLSEWEHFYRLLDDEALLHVFRVACGLDSAVLGEPEIVSQLKAAWEQAKRAESTVRFLDALMEKALAVSERVRQETALEKTAVSISSAAVELARRAVGMLNGKKVLLLGTGKTSELAARGLVSGGASSICVLARNYEQARELAVALGGTAVSLEDRWQQMAAADVVISPTCCPQTILSREEAENLARERRGRPLVIVDFALPRNVDPGVRQVPGIFLYDIDDLNRVAQAGAGEREAAATEAMKIVRAESQRFRRKLLAERVLPTIAALRHRLDQICRQELDSFRQECGPFSKDEDETLQAVTSRVTQRIAGSLARELKELPEPLEQEMTAAVQRLFHLETPETALAGTRS